MVVIGGVEQDVNIFITFLLTRVNVQREKYCARVEDDGATRIDYSHLNVRYCFFFVTISQVYW